MKRKPKTDLGNIRFVIILIAAASIGALYGFLIYRSKGNIFAEMSSIIWILVFLLIGSIFHTFIHELVHLVCGLATGYGFTSFRVGRFMLVKKQGKLTLKRFSLMGTGGQCLMSPPNIIDGKMPCIRLTTC